MCVTATRCGKYSLRQILSPLPHNLQDLAIRLSASLTRCEAPHVLNSLQESTGIDTPPLREMVEKLVESVVESLAAWCNHLEHSVRLVVDLLGRVDHRPLLVEHSFESSLGCTTYRYVDDAALERYGPVLAAHVKHLCSPRCRV